MTSDTRPTEADPRFRRGLDLFNAGRYFDAHEEWEHLWRECDPADRRFVHALIHAAVALYQWERGNAAGARTQLDRGRAKAPGSSPNRLGVDFRSLWEAVAAALDSPPGSTPAPTLSNNPHPRDGTEDD